MNRKLENGPLYSFLLLYAVLQVILLFLNEKAFGGADSITHFQIAHHAFKYPRLFLDLWGKPLYTTFAAPFALFGFKAAQLFNVVAGLASMWLLYKLSRHFFEKARWLVIVLTAFAPTWFLLFDSCLTEVLFGFVVLLSVFLFVREKYIWASVVLSFIPFVRSEGIVFFPVFLVVLSMIRRFRAIPFLALGTLFYSLVGLFAFGDFLWLINRFPYPTGESVYGSGSLFHFVKQSNFIFGVPFLILLLTGLFYWIYEVLSGFSLLSKKTILFLLVVGVWLGYFAAHSFVWWRGVGGSLGLTRVIGGVIPVAAITLVKGIEFIFRVVKKERMAMLLVLALAILQVFLFFKQNDVPSKLSPTDRLLNKAAAFVSKEKPEGKIYYFNPVLAFYLNLDPYDREKSIWGVGDKMQPSNSMDFDDLLVWDAHFGPNEGRTTLESLVNDPFMQELKVLVPAEKITVLGGYDYSIHIFRKVKAKQKLLAKVLTRKVPINNSSDENIREVDGTKAFEIQAGTEYGPNVVFYIGELEKGDVYEVELKAEYRTSTKIDAGELVMVISVEDKNKKFKYSTFPLEYENGENTWRESSLKTRFTSEVPDDAMVKMYIWNKGRKNISLKEFSAEIRTY